MRRLPLLALATALTLAITASTALARPVYTTSLNASNVSVFDGQTGRSLGAPIPFGSLPLAITVSPDGNRVYVTNAGSRSISVIDALTDQVVASVPVSGSPVEMALSTDGGTAYAPALNGIDIIELGANPHQVGVIPTTRLEGSAALSGDGSTLYVTNFQGNSLEVFDLRSQSLVASVPAGEQPTDVAVSPDGSKLYVTDREGDSVTVLAAATHQVLDTIPADNGPDQIVLTPDGTKAYVSAEGGEGSLDIIDLIGDRQIDVIKGHFPGTTNGDLAISPDGGTVFVSNLEEPGTISRIGTQLDRPIAAPIPIDPGLSSFAINPFDVPPVASLAGPTSVRLGSGASFDGAASRDIDGAIAGFNWAFGDGSPAVTTPQAQHTFTTAGTFTTSLAVTDQEGCSTGPLRSGATVVCQGSPRSLASQTVQVLNPAFQVACPTSLIKAAKQKAKAKRARKPKKHPVKGTKGKKGKSKPKNGGKAARRGKTAVVCKASIEVLTKSRKGSAETNVATATIKAGRSQIVAVAPKPKYVISLGTARLAFVKETLKAGAITQTNLRRLLVRQEGEAAGRAGGPIPKH